MAVLGYSQNHLAVAGGCAAIVSGARLRRTHPLPRGGSDSVQARPLVAQRKASIGY